MIVFPAPAPFTTPPLQRFINGAYSLGANGHWPLDETSGTRARDLIGANHGTYTGGYTLGAQGLLGPACKFDGSTGYVTIPDSARYSLVTTNALTLFIVVKTSSVDSLSIVSKAAASNYEWAIVQEATTPMNIYCQIWNLAGTGVAVFGSPNSNVAGVWHTFMVTMDNVGKNLMIYSDGLFRGNTTTWANTPGDGTSPMNIGRRGDNAQYYDGVAQHLLVFPRMLTTTDAAYLDRLARAA